MKKALYRAFRPKTFDEVLGQDHIVRVLKNQVERGNPSHAYLFAGSRGTGKTSCAKIFSRAVNCLHPVDGNPCNECENCKAILEETTMDVVEMDAASNRRIDDIRELKEHVIYPPSTLKYKVYIIDEAHMITKEAFNALLKIMEEPPEHLIFIMATTDPDQVPDTILSRLQRFEFKRLDMESIEKNIEHIANVLDLTVEKDALHAMAIAADGAMRDALSLMDQVLAGGEKEIREETVRKVLGTIGYEATDKLVRSIFQNDLSNLLSQSQALISSGKDPQVIIKECVEYYRLLMLAKGMGEQAKGLPTDPFQRNAIFKTASMTDMIRILDGLEFLISSEELFKRSDFSEALLQASLVKLVYFISDKGVASKFAQLDRRITALENGTRLMPISELSSEDDLNENSKQDFSPNLSNDLYIGDERKGKAKENLEKKDEKQDGQEGKEEGKYNLNSSQSDIDFRVILELAAEKIEEEKLFASALFKTYKDVKEIDDRLYIIYAKSSPVFKIIKDKEKSIEKILREIGKSSWIVEICREGDISLKERPSISEIKESKESKEKAEKVSNDSIEKIRQYIDEDLLEIRD